MPSKSSESPLPENSGPIQFGPYELIHRIGAGGMGEVYLARETAGGVPRACVVKKVLPTLIENRAEVRRVQNLPRALIYGVVRTRLGLLERTRRKSRKHGQPSVLHIVPLECQETRSHYEN